MAKEILEFEGCVVEVVSCIGMTKGTVRFKNINAYYTLPVVRNDADLSATEYLSIPEVRDEIFKSACAYGTVAMDFLDCEKYMHNLLSVTGGYDGSNS